MSASNSSRKIEMKLVDFVFLVRCDECGEVCNSRFKLAAHKLCHSIGQRVEYTERQDTQEQAFYCKDCGKSFFRGCDLRAHLKKMHTDGLFKCNFCPVSFRSSTGYSIHQTQMHTSSSNISEYECKICGTL